MNTLNQQYLSILTDSPTLSVSFNPMCPYNEEVNLKKKKHFKNMCDLIKLNYNVCVFMIMTHHVTQCNSVAH